MSRGGTRPPPEGVGDRIRRLMVAGGMEQAGLAEAVGVHRVAVANWERGQHRPAAEHLPRLAGALGVTVDYLLMGDAGVYRDAYERIAAIVRETDATGPGAGPGDEVRRVLDEQGRGGAGADSVPQARRR